MSDWRKQPRQGRSQFLPLLDEIKSRLVLGETQKMIFESYPDLEMSYPQFTRYVKKYCLSEITQVTKVPEHKATPEKTNTDDGQLENKSRMVVRNPSDLKKLRSQPIDLEELQNSAGEEDESSNS
ncbi:hypothetical protein E2Q31_16470 [Salmonella enterica subsp. enterica serovar Oranienburg]|uniref:Uncharacterized protein n=1 Tax=Salmonella enterica TaxID=28901 RepID=A0A742YUH7_SALER|nr:hypothetical protein [Salmonella enterica subsp. enterica serovar Adelaide]EBQ9876101.1 hypothetical protein [Salmonella enterica subsp. enterica serovar Takoradi]EBZ6487452.1 hypothetical protein [Salmonella enterica subsp. enterica serovar Kottbus]ECD6379754.1 hypothetical protein [Salmonella enterica subsp. enterica serovar Oranienburg]ECG4909160.1 hypothetical protein [Salmonella enterica subsp. enterica serovar Pomona]ECQ0797044.1 hypothetical protein [Salmonella enterica subsp. enteri